MAKRYYKRRRYTTKKKATVSIPRVRKLMNYVAERKYLDLTVAGANVASTWSYHNPLASIIQGTTASTRIGNRIFVHSISYTVTCAPLAGMNTTGCVARMVLFHDKECMGSTPNALDMWEANEFNTQRNSAKLPKFRILKDMTHTMVVTAYNAGIAAAGPLIGTIMVCRPRKVIQYSANNNGIADILKDNYGMGHVASHAASCNVYMKVKVIFSDC
jgi:hypothetical protein